MSVRELVQGCRTCRSSEAYTDGKQGLLKPLPIPEQYWTDISMDFITPLPECIYGGRKYKHIGVVVCRLSKRKRFLALESLDVEHVALKFLEWIWREEGYPKSIVSDRGSQFVSYCGSGCAKGLERRQNSPLLIIRETQLAWAQAVQKDYADRHRIPAPEIRVGDWIMLDARNVTTNRPSHKLDYKNLDRFKVLEVAKNCSAVKLDLPTSYKIFP